MSDREPASEESLGADSSTGTETTAVPDWDDEYVDRVSDRLMHNYDLEKDRSVDGERFTLYGRMDLASQKHFLHPSISIAEHESTEHLFVDRVDSVDDRLLDRYVDLGHQLADDWIDPDEEHYSTEFTFVAVAPSIPDEIRSRVAGFSERTLLKYGYNGHYEINLAVVAPEPEDLVASENADIATAFRLWERIERKEVGLLGLIARRLQL
ncbi:hypothetical protein [Natrinema versiforme]|uniref:DUF8052 domain-containing protein n=1 Tax=Natrinema versiforme TaxID=88724 RepID=A0A4P8WIL2_9EURY|nr:hypothetical protein [Natrinema versiforme]QCS41843.1 hypothetical protein FEJ81_05540 [Natrinema versiforme]